jgi:hypothetical protein
LRVRDPGKERAMLDRISIATPCKASWEEMRGDERVRFCDACELNVYNLSAMTATEATALVARSEGHLCTRFFRRDDGTVLTRDCPVGLAARVGRQVRWAALWFLAALGLSSFATACRLSYERDYKRVQMYNTMGPTTIIK